MDVISVEHGETSTVVRVRSVDVFRDRIILDEGNDTKGCAVYYRDSDKKEARWIHCKGRSNLWHCSACGSMMLYNPTRRVYNIEKKAMSELNRFCRSCGARMIGEKK